MRLIKILLLLQLIISLNSCGPLAYKKVDARKVEWDPQKRVAKNLEEGRGFKLFDNERKLGTNYEFASSNELWRATLDIINFMPLTTANYSGGIIVTDWYSILAVPLTERSPACANVVAASVPAKAVKPIFFKFVIFTPIVIVVITNSVFLAKCFFFSEINGFYPILVR